MVMPLFSGNAGAGHAQCSIIKTHRPNRAKSFATFESLPWHSQPRASETPDVAFHALRRHSPPNSRRFPCTEGPLKEAASIRSLDPSADGRANHVASKGLCADAEGLAKTRLASVKGSWTMKKLRWIGE